MQRTAWLWPTLCVAALTAQAMPPIRVVSLAPNLTGMVVELGCEKSLVAVTPFCDASETIARVPGGMQPEAEAVLALEPDLVLASSITPSSTLRQLKNLGVRTEVFTAGSLQEIRDATAKLAGVLGVETLDIATPTNGPATKTAVLLFGADTGYSAGCGTHAHEILESAGLRNIAAKASGPWPQLSEEFLLAEDPEVIVVADYGGADKSKLVALLRAHPVRKHLQAVQAGRVVVFPAQAFSIPGPAALKAGHALRDEVEKL